MKYRFLLYVKDIYSSRYLDAKKDCFIEVKQLQKFSNHTKIVYKAKQNIS